MSKGEITRAAILEGATRLASQVGLDGLTIGALASALDLSKSGLFAHFQSKEKLQLDVIEYATTNFVERVIRPSLARPRGEPRVRALFEGWLKWEEDELHNPGGCIFIAASTEFDDRPGPVRDALARDQRALADVVARAARISVEEGHFRRDLDVKQFSQEVFGIILAYHHFHRLLGDARAREHAERAFEALLAASRTR